MDETKKEIESLKRKTFYLSIIVIVIVMAAAYAVSVFSQTRRYTTIQDYYFDSLDLDRELNRSLENLELKIEEIQSKYQ